MSVADIVMTRKLEEVVHFTTNRGCLGTLYTEALKSRARLESEPLVEHLFRPNAQFRKDAAFLDYVSLSIGWINKKFFDTCSERWHQGTDVFWVILSFKPTCLSDPGVIFSTTNNIYTGVLRGHGATGFERLFANPVSQWHSRTVRRADTLSDAFPTCEQAEALYPGEVSTRFLQRIYTRTEAERSEVMGFFKGTWHDPVEVRVEPFRFDGRPS